MTVYGYQLEAMRTNDHRDSERLGTLLSERCGTGWQDKKDSIGGLLHGCLGLSGEVGEFNDLIKKWIFHEKEVTEEHLKKELGDSLWYIALICDSMGWELEEIMKMNVDKLKARYPKGFNVYDANHRKEGDI